MEPSITVIRQKKSSQVVKGAFKVHAPTAGEKIVHTLEPFTEEGESVPDVGLLMVLFSRWLDQSNREMVEADLAHEHELADDQQYRDSRDDATQRLGRLSIALRGACVSYYGPQRLEEIGFSERTSRDPETIATIGRNLVNVFRDPQITLPTPVLGQKFTIEPLDMVELLEPIVEELEASLEAVNLETKKAQTTQAVKNEKVEVHNHRFFWIARWLEASFHLVGMKHEGERVKPSIRRRGRLASLDESETDEVDDSGEVDDSDEDPQHG